MRSVFVTIVVASPYFERREPVLTVDTGGAVPPRNNFMPLTGRDDMVVMQYTVHSMGLRVPVMGPLWQSCVSVSAADELKQAKHRNLTNFSLHN